MTNFAYGRVSTRDQDVQNQRLEIENAGYTVDYWFSDEGVSGATTATQRPQFKALLEKIRDGEQLVVAKIDRLGRDAQDIGATIKLLASRKIKVIVLQLGQLDLASSAGKMMLTMLGAMAELERDLLIERTQAGLARAKAQGKVLGRPTMTTAQDRAKIVALHAIGHSLNQLAKQFGIGKATVHDVIKAAKASAPAEQPPVDADRKLPAPTPAKASKRARKPAAALMSDDMTERMTMEQKHGQHRLPAV